MPKINIHFGAGGNQTTGDRQPDPIVNQPKPVDPPKPNIEDPKPTPTKPIDPPKPTPTPTKPVDPPKRNIEDPTPAPTKPVDPPKSNIEDLTPTPVPDKPADPISNVEDKGKKKNHDWSKKALPILLGVLAIMALVWLLSKLFKKKKEDKINEPQKDTKNNTPEKTKDNKKPDNESNTEGKENDNELVNLNFAGVYDNNQPKFNKDQEDQMSAYAEMASDLQKKYGESVIVTYSGASKNGTDKRNNELGVQRNQNVVSIFEKNGVKNIHSTSIGAHAATLDGTSKDGYAGSINDRTSFVSIGVKNKEQSQYAVEKFKEHLMAKGYPEEKANSIANSIIAGPSENISKSNNPQSISHMKYVEEVDPTTKKINEEKIKKMSSSLTEKEKETFLKANNRENNPILTSKQPQVNNQGNEENTLQNPTTTVPKQSQEKNEGNNNSNGKFEINGKVTSGGLSNKPKDTDNKKSTTDNGKDTNKDKNSPKDPKDLSQMTKETQNKNNKTKSKNKDKGNVK